jgi:hypothetical protein
MLNEYAGPNDVIFAIAWSGKRHPPDMRPLLGQHFNKFSTAIPPKGIRRGGRTPRNNISSGDLVVERSTRIRGVHSGRAYLISLLPTGVTVDEIQ